MPFLKLQNSTFVLFSVSFLFFTLHCSRRLHLSNIQGDDYRLRTMIGISSKSPQLTHPEMEDRGSARSYNRSVEDLIKFFTSRKTAKANHTTKPGSLRQDSNLASAQPDHRTATIPRSGLKINRSVDSTNERRTQRRARFEDSLPTVSTGLSFEEDVKKAAGLDQHTRPSIPDIDEEEKLLDARLQEAKDRCKEGLRPAHAVAWVGSDVNKPHPTRRRPELPRNGFRDILVNPERRVARSRVKKFSGRTQLLPFLARGTIKNPRQSQRAGETAVSSSAIMQFVPVTPRRQSNDKGSNSIESCLDEAHHSRSLLLLIQDRTNTPQSAYLRGPLEQMINALKETISSNTRNRLYSKSTAVAWNAYDQALLDLSRMIDDDMNEDKFTTTRVQQSSESINSRPQYLANYSPTALNKTQVRRLLSTSSSVHPRFINTTPPSLERPIDSLPTSPVEHKPSGSTSQSKPPIPPRAPTRPTTPYSLSPDPDTRTTSPPGPSESSIPSLLVEAKTSNITRQLLSVTEFPQDKDGMRDSGVGIWTEEEICFVRAGIAFADGVGE